MAVVFNRRRAVASGGFIIEGSGLFGGDDDYLERTPSSSGNSKTFTIRMIVKKTTVTPQELLITAGNGSYIYFNNDILRVYLGETILASVGSVDTLAVFRDTSAWLDIVVACDTTQVTGADRIKIYINGVEAGTTINSVITQNGDTHFNSSSYVHRIGAFNFKATNEFSGYAASAVMIDGLALDPTSFGELTDDGYWQINDASSLTFGTNGFLIEGGTDVAAGTDSSGNSNDFTPAGTITSTLDSCTNDAANGYGNYCTWAANDVDDDTVLSNGNLSADRTAAVVGGTVHSGLYVPKTGKWAFKHTVATSSKGLFIGIADARQKPRDFTAGQAGNANYAYVQTYDSGATTAEIYNETTPVSTGLTAIVATDVVEVLIDADNATMDFKVNGAAFGSQVTSITLQKPWKLFLGSGDIFDLGTSDFGQISYTPSDSSYKTIATQNFPTPAVPDYTTEYHVEKFTHDGSSHVITLPWNTSTDTMVRIKNVDDATGTADWYVFDTVRGDNVSILWNDQTVAEATNANSCAFSSTSVTLGSFWDADGYIIEAFKVGDYFRIHTYTGTGTAHTETYAAALNSAPGMMFFKCRTSTSENLVVYHEGTGNTGGFMAQNSNAFLTNAVWFENTSPTTTGFRVGTGTSTNVSGAAFVTYHWANSGPYAFGSYEGNANADGPVINVGGKPASWFGKTADRTNSWYLFQTVRSPGNVADESLAMDTTAAEATGINEEVDILSTGIKVRTTGSSLNDSATMVYGAFGITPIQGSDPSSSPNQGRAV